MTDPSVVRAEIPDSAIPAKNGGWIRPWAKGQSGNPSGKAKDGGGSKDHPLRATLRKRLAKRRAMLRFVDAWIEAAIGGDSAAREQILKRLDPVLEDPAAGRQVLEGIRLQLAPGMASIELMRGLTGQGSAGLELREISEVGVPEGGLVTPQMGLTDPQIAPQESQEPSGVPPPGVSP